MPIFWEVKLITVRKFLTLYHWMLFNRRNFITIEQIKRLLRCCDSTAYRYRKAIDELNSLVNHYCIRRGSYELQALMQLPEIQTTQSRLSFNEEQ